LPHDGACAAGLKMVSIDTGPARDTSAVVEELGNRSPCDGVWRTAGASCGCGRAKKASNVRSCALECSISQDPSAAQGVAQVSSPRGVVFWLRRTKRGDETLGGQASTKRQRSVNEASTKRQRSVNDALMRSTRAFPSKPNPFDGNKRAWPRIHGVRRRPRTRHAARRTELQSHIKALAGALMVV